MMRLVDRSSGYLFSSLELSNLIEDKARSMQEELEKIEVNQFLNTSSDDLLKYLTEKYSLIAPILQRNHWSASEEEVQIDVRNDRNRHVFDKSRPCLIPGQRIDVEVPVFGDVNLLYARPSNFTFNPPRAQIRNSSIFLTFATPNDVLERDIKQETEQILDQIEQYINSIQRDVSKSNQELCVQINQLITARRARILANQGRAANLGIPLKSRSDSPQTYTLPAVSRKIVPTLPKASKNAFEPEPILGNENYEHILTVIQNMAQVMERSPTAFESMKEEDLRQHFLVQLNGQFEGAATGETFNVNGKTDILLRFNGKNIFIAECKFWKGSKQYQETISQILGYTAWRDTKTALLIFNRGRQMSKVLETIQEQTPIHENYKRTVNWSHESGFRYIFHHVNDLNREFVLTVLVFDVPKST